MSLRYCLAALLLAAASSSTSAFSVTSCRPRTGALRADATSEPEPEYEEPGMNPNNPNLPELKGDFDWDAKFGGDDDWITEDVPGKIVLDELTLAKQAADLDKLEEKWRKMALYEEYEAERNVGWTENAEVLNGRFAMFFLVTGLLTEYWTDVTLPGQVEEMLRVGGFIGFE